MCLDYWRNIAELTIRTGLREKATSPKISKLSFKRGTNGRERSLLQRHELFHTGNQHRNEAIIYHHRRNTVSSQNIEGIKVLGQTQGQSHDVDLRFIDKRTTSYEK